MDSLTTVMQMTPNCSSLFPHPPVPTCVSECLVDISAWTAAHHLKLNLSKTELLFIPVKDCPCMDLSVTAENVNITFIVEEPAQNSSPSASTSLYYISRPSGTPITESKRSVKSQLFCVLVPQWWNELPPIVRTAEKLAIFLGAQVVESLQRMPHMQLTPVRS